MRRSLILLSLIPVLAFAFRPLQEVIPDLQSWTSLGVGGLIAGMVLYWKRGDDKAYVAKIEVEHTRYTQLLERFSDQTVAVNEKVLEVVVANTKALTELVSAINYQARQRRQADSIIDITEARNA